MQLYKHPVKKTSFSVEILGKEMSLQAIEGTVTTFFSEGMSVEIEELKIESQGSPADRMAYLESALDEIQVREDKKGHRFIEEPEIFPVLERSLLIQDGITERRVRVITFLSILQHSGEDYFSIVRGRIQDHAILTEAFIQSVFTTLKGNVVE